jgi:hypothetical protein
MQRKSAHPFRVGGGLQRTDGRAQLPGHRRLQRQKHKLL